jgi:hypothetical protein
MRRWIGVALLVGLLFALKSPVAAGSTYAAETTVKRMVVFEGFFTTT